MFFIQDKLIKIERRRETRREKIPLNLMAIREFLSSDTLIQFII